VQVTLRQDKKRRTRLLIANTALRLFVERGYDRTTIDEIAMTAEVGTRTLYRYFPTKEDLLVMMARPGLRALVTGLCDRPDEEPLHDALFAALDRFCAGLSAERKRGVLIRDLIEHIPSVRARVQDEWQAARADLAKEIRRRMAAPRTDPRPELAAGTMMVILDYVVATWASSRRSPSRVAEQAARLLNEGAVPLPRWGPVPPEGARS
jgi:AcrR family transcriptional regulator